MDASAAPPPPPGAGGVADRERFVAELEFVQLLASPAYLNHLAQARRFEEPAFRAFLRYLRYWRRPEYARFLVYPQALYFLERVQDPAFCAQMALPGYRDMVHAQQFYAWLHLRANRMGGGGEGGRGAPAAAAAAAAGAAP